MNALELIDTNDIINLLKLTLGYERHNALVLQVRSSRKKDQV